MMSAEDMAKLDGLAATLVECIIAQNCRPVIFIDENGINIEGYQEGKVSRWIFFSGSDTMPPQWTCGNCGHSERAGTKYCPSCGCEMRATVL